MAGIPVVLETFSWSTRRAAEAAFRDILRNSGYSVGDVVSDPVHHRMLIELLERHPDHVEKSGPGVQEFFIARTRDASGVFVGANAIGIWIRRIDGEEVDFSYTSAIRQHSVKSDAKEALRFEVDDRRQGYREARFAAGKGVRSDLSGDEIEHLRDAQVIYMSPTWGQLTHQFAESEGGWEKLTVTPAASGSAAVGSRLADRSQAGRWLVFHTRHANLGVATASEASRRREISDLGWVPDDPSA
ncbi:MAG: DCL family protein [Kocuria sp.]|uniref:DCL family protein n=1 Tax=Kocuria sp. TaxID=1871328 RepID=UPI0026DD1E33|nr:DCL family protein [Kocuria sp.]MDO4256339.1 DCL family protein [Kocuria sp.]